MPTADQLHRLIWDEFDPNEQSESLHRAAEKIVALFDDNGSVLVAAAALENEVTSTLLDMAVATVLATLIEEEGGGRSNISYSPMSMDHMNQHYLYEVSNEGLIRTVRIKLREDSDLNDESKWREPSNRHSLVDTAPATDTLKPQAEPKDYNRPMWVIRNGQGSLFKMFDRADAERQLRGDKVAVPHAMQSKFGDDPLATIENRWCLHVECPSTGCNHDPEKRDKPEATSD